MRQKENHRDSKDRMESRWAVMFGLKERRMKSRRAGNWRLFPRLFAMFMAVVFTLYWAGPVWATVSEARLRDECDSSGACYYNPIEDCATTGGVGIAAGDDVAAQIWNYFATAAIPGLSDNAAAIAGILGNMYRESSFNPFIVGGGGGNYYGLFQAYRSYNQPMLDQIQAAGLSQYWSSAYQSSAPPDAIQKAVQIELDYLVHHYGGFGSGNFSFVENLNAVANKTPESYAELFEVTVERAVGGSDPLQDSGVINLQRRMYNGQYSINYQDAAGRREAARQYYEMFADSAITSSSSTTDAEGWLGGIEGLQKQDARGRADLRETPAGSFATDNGKANMIVLHYTAGTTNGLAAYGSNMFPAHFTIDLKKKEGYQHFPLSEPSLAVASYDRYAIQIEIVGVGYADWGGVDPSSPYNLANFGEAEWDYLAYYLNAIAAHTGVPLETSVQWDSPNHKLSDGEARSYRGVLGHMHLPNNPGKVDPGDIWDDVKAALIRNPSSVYNASCTGGGGGSVSGGLTLEQAKNFMAAYKSLQDSVGRASGYVTEWDIYAACSPALANCVAFSQYFINRYTVYYSQNHWMNTVDGAQVVRTLLNYSSENNFTSGGTIPRPYAIFSRAGSSFGGAGHTGVILGVNEAEGKVIIGEAGCNNPAFTGAKEADLAEYSSGRYTYAYTEGVILLDEIQKTVNTGQ